MNPCLPIQTLRAANLTFSYGSRAILNDVSLQTQPGDLVALVGPNGCGKSTLLRLLVGELPPKSGTILLDGTEARALGRIAVAQRISLVPQQLGSGASGAAFGYTVREIVLMARHASHTDNGPLAMGFETPADLQLANESMWATDVHHLADRSINTLSGGERQRVAIARAFTQNTPVMLLDEPTSALDLYHQLELMEQLRRATQEEQRIVLLVTHDLNLAAAHASRIVVMDQGRIVASGTPAEVLTAKVLEPVYRVKVHATDTGELHFHRMTK